MSLDEAHDQGARLLIEDLDEQLVAAQVSGDVTTLQRLLAKDLTGGNMFGAAFTRANLPELYKAGEVRRDRTTKRVTVTRRTSSSRRA